MNWNSVTEFVAMGGYGLYVWGSFGACLLAFVVEFILVGRRRMAIERSLRRQALAQRLDAEAA